jgi:mannose-6-phosphate isomerase-like protein (cupin superfamily)
MKFVSSRETKHFASSTVCEAIEYPLSDKNINATVIKLSGKYPDKGWAVNEKCKELVYVIKGHGKLITETNSVDLSEKDVVLIEANEKYMWEGNLELFMPSTPAWYPEQHKIIVD